MTLLSVDSLLISTVSSSASSVIFLVLIVSAFFIMFQYAAMCHGE